MNEVLFDTVLSHRWLDQVSDVHQATLVSPSVLAEFLTMPGRSDTAGSLQPDSCTEIDDDISVSNSKDPQWKHSIQDPCNFLNTLYFTRCS